MTSKSTIDLKNYDPAVVDTAFRLQQKIKRDGLEGIGYMDRATVWIEAEAKYVVEENIETELSTDGW